MKPDSQLPTIKFERLSAAGKAKLLDMALMPFVFGISSIPACALALAIWAAELNSNAGGFAVWGGAYIAAALAIQRISRRYQQQRQQLPDDRLLAKWIPIVCRIALAHGIGLAVPALWMTSQAFPFDFVLLYYVVIAIIIAAFATHLTPLLSAFRRLFFPCWSLLIFLTPWTFPDHWHFMLLLEVAFALSIHKHSLSGQQFFLKQILLEENEAQLKEQAESALKAKNQFLTTASHDLRQPLHAMGFLLESIAGRNQDPALSAALSDLKQSLQSVTQMFNSLLDLSKIELGAVEVNPTPIAINQLLDEVASVFREEAHSRQLSLRIRPSKHSTAVLGDALLVRRAVVNLIQNALRYTQKGGVLIGVRRSDNHCRIEVWDTGIGVALEDHDKIHSPFYRNQHAWHLENAGHGLGLAVVARCAELMNASHGFASRENRGSKFWLRLPFADHEASPPQLAPIQKNRVIPQLSGNCLIIDDDPQVQRAWESLLSSWGIVIRSAASSVEALAILDSGFDAQAILCDQRLRAGECGFELLQALMERCPQAHGAMISGEFNSPELTTAENEGFLVLRKPLDPELLHSLLSRWLSQATTASD